MKANEKVKPNWVAVMRLNSLISWLALEVWLFCEYCGMSGKRFSPWLFGVMMGKKGRRIK